MDLLLHAAEHIEDRHLHPRQRAPQRDAIQLVVIVVTVGFPQQILEIARVFLQKHRRDQVLEDAVEVVGTRRIADRNTFRSIGGAHADKIILVQLSAVRPTG